MSKRDSILQKLQAEVSFGNKGTERLSMNYCIGLEFKTDYMLETVTSQDDGPLEDCFRVSYHCLRHLSDDKLRTLNVNGYEEKKHWPKIRMAIDFKITDDLDNLVSHVTALSSTMLNILAYGTDYYYNINKNYV